LALVFKDDLFDAQWLRTAGHSAYRGAEIGECFAAARQIRDGDAGSWFAGWYGFADRLAAAADKSRADGHTVSALGAYLRAANYFRAAFTFLIGTPVDPRVVDAYRRQRTAFEAAVRLMRPGAERVSIPYGQTSLHGYFFKASDDGLRRPTLIVNGGYDSTAEEGYFFGAAAAVARGYNAIVFDGPGQGAAIIEQGLVFRPDWEAVIGPVVDWALTRPEVEPAKIALIGVSFGGYLAPRAASGEPRLAACIADPGEYSLIDEFKSRLPPFIARELPDGKPWVLSLLAIILGRRLRHPTAGWGLRRGLWVHGVKTPLDYLRLTKEYSLAACADRIRCPTLICRADEDEIGVTAKRLYDALSCEKALLTFSGTEGAGAHCEAGARTLFNERVFDWLDAALAKPRPIAI
jgi:pimeloyl-ACP methyl ester carboxylesterase